MKQVFIIISNANAGIKTYESNLIKLLIKKNKKFYLVLEKKEYLNEIRKYKNHFIYFCNAIWEPFKVINYIFKIKKKITSEKIIFIINNPVILVLYFWLLKFFFKNKKIIFIKHSHITHFSIFQITVNFVSSILCNFIDKVIFVSSFTRQWWCKYFFLYKFTKNIVFNNFINLPKKINKRKIRNNFNIGFVGRLEEEKGFAKFLEIATKIKNSELKFLIYGNKKKQKYLNKNIKFCGWQNPNKIYKCIDLLLITSPIENCPFTVLESKSYSIPTLSLAGGGIKEIIQNNKDGILLKNDSSVKYIEKKIIYIKKNYNYFSNNCYRNSKIFDVEFLDKKISSLFTIS